MMENWKIIENTNDMFSISDIGRIKNNKTKRILKTQTNRKGYHIVRVTINKMKRTFRIHRLVALYFIDNPFNKEQVNHIDGNKNNNNVSNLEWVTNRENAIHAIKNGLWSNVFKKSKEFNDKKKTPILAKNIYDGTTIIFSSMREAEKALKTKHINAVIKKERSQSKGYVFSYYKGGDVPNGVIYN